MKIIIEKNVPLPVGRHGKGHWDTVAASMEVGDSVFLLKVGAGNQTALGNALRRIGARYTTRQMDGGIRVWRTE